MTVWWGRHCISHLWGDRMSSWCSSLSLVYFPRRDWWVRVVLSTGRGYTDRFKHCRLAPNLKNEKENGLALCQRFHKNTCKWSQNTYTQEASGLEAYLLHGTFKGVRRDVKLLIQEEIDKVIPNVTEGICRKSLNRRPTQIARKYICALIQLLPSNSNHFWSHCW